ncbi:MAG: delta-60 repeat domain-containing protein, partial [Saprospiraceae bacterium]
MNFRNCFLILIICLFSIALVKAAGEVDTSFNASYYTSSTGSIKRIFVQPDGKFLVGGTFKAINGKSYNGIARFNTDGTLDTNFTPPDLYSLNGTIVKGADVNAIAMQSTGKILIGGNFLGYDSTPAPGILRLNPNGTIDTTFVSSSGITTDIKVFPDDKFMLAKGNDTKRNADGTLDTSSLINYNTIYSKAVAIQPDGSVISAQQDIIRYDPSGILDTAFTVTTNGEVKELISQPDGKILVGGTFTQINNGFPARGIIRLNPNGSIDTSFIGLTNGASKNVNGITLLPNGKIAIAGDFANYSGVNRLGVAILNSDGSLDNSFVNTNNFSNINDIDILNDGKIIIGGDAIFNSQSALIIANANGSFNSEPKIGNTIRNNRVAIQTDGKILVGGGSNYASNLVTNRIARFNGNDGSVDTSFLSSLTSSMNLINAMILEQPQGSIIAGGDLNGYRFTSNGTMV